MNDPHDKLHALLARRNNLNGEIERLRGKLEGAKANLASLEADCNQRGVDPAKLEETLEKLKTRYAEVVEVVGENLAEAERRLAPFQEYLDI